MSDAHADAYRFARLRITAALRTRHADDVEAVVFSDGSVAVMERKATTEPAAAGMVPVVVYVRSIPRRTAEHPLPQRTARNTRGATT